MGVRGWEEAENLHTEASTMLISDSPNMRTEIRAIAWNIFLISGQGYLGQQTAHFLDYISDNRIFSARGTDS
jgi:hypothetical protein